MSTIRLFSLKGLIVSALRFVPVLGFCMLEGQTVVAQTPSASTSTVSASSRIVATNGTTTLTIQLKESNGNNISTGGASVTIPQPSAGTVGAVTDNGNGTYSAVYTAGASSGTVTITPRLSGVDFTNTITLIIGNGQLLRANQAGTSTNTTSFSTNGGLAFVLGLEADYLIVGGGGGGGGGINAAWQTGGGGGGGGWVSTGTTAIDFTAHAATVGSGGSGGTGAATSANITGGTAGGLSSIFGITANGGGGGTGGTGGSSGRIISGSSTATAGGGNSFEGAGGGAGAGAGGSNGTDISMQGGNGGTGGAGSASSITGGTPVFYGGGGGGGGGWKGSGSSSTDGSGGNGGNGGGGNGAQLARTNAVAGVVNLGGGGGGGGYTDGTLSTAHGAAGGTGVVIVRYQGNDIATGGSKTTTTVSSQPYNVHTFNGTGTFSLSASNAYLSSLSATYSGVLSGTGSLTYNNLGTLDLTGNHTYTGGTNIQNGTLKFSGGQANASGNFITLTGASTLVFNTTDIFTQHTGTPLYTITLNNGTTLTNGGLVYNVLGPLTLSGGTISYNTGSPAGGKAFAFKNTVTVNGSITSTISGDGFELGAAGVSAVTFDVFDGSADHDLLISGVLRNGANTAWNGFQASALTKAGSGKMVLSGANSYTGGTNLNGGILTLASAGAIGSSGTISLGGGTLQYSSNNTTDYSGRFSTASNQAYSIHTNGQNVTFASALTSASGTLTKLGTGVLTLTGANTYSSITTISEGSLQIGNGSTTGTLGSGNVTNNATLIFNRSNDLAVSNLISGTGAVTKNGAGILTLSAANTYSGATTISAGELRVNGSIASSSGVTVSSGATLSGTGTLSSTTVSGIHAPGTSPGVQTISGNLTYSSGSAINWELINNTIGTRGTDYDGIDVTGNLDFAGTTTLNLIFNASGSAVDWNNAFWSTAKTGLNGWKVFDVPNGTISGLSNITVNAATNWVDVNTKVLRTQRVSNGTFALEQVGTAVYLTYTPFPVSAFTITGINAVVQVNTAITGVQLTAVDANGSTVTAFTSTATLGGTAGISGTTAGFTGGVLTTTLTPVSVGAGRTLTVTNSTYSISGSSTFDVVSALLTGSQVVDGTSGDATNSSYYSTSGDLSLSQGFFVDYLIVGGGGAGGVGKNGSTGGGGGGGAGGVLTGSLNINGANYAITVGVGGSGYVPATGTGVNGGNSSGFGLTALGGGGGASEWSGGPAATGGSGGGAGGNGSALGSGTIGQGNNGGSAGNGSAGGGGGAGAVGSNGSGTTGGAGGAGLASSITGSSVTYGGGGGGGTSGTGLGGAGGAGGGGAGGSSSSRSGSAGTPNTGGGGGGVAGYGGSVGNGGSGIVILRYAGESLGAIGGTVSSGTGTAAGYTLHRFLSSGNFDLTSLTTQTLNNRLRATLTQGISGTGNLTYSGPGRLIFSANSTYTGSTTISSGTLQIGDGGTTGSLGTGNITNSGTLSFQRSDSYTLPGTISGSGSVEQFGSGTLDLGGFTNHQAGTWTLRSGSISNGTISSGNFSVIDGTVSAILSGAGTLTKTGGGTVTLSGNNTYTGTTTVSAGTLRVNGTHNGSGTVSVASGAVLTGAGTLAGNTTIQTGGTLEPGNNLGALSFGGDLTLSGGGSLNWKIDDASGTAGTDWSTVNVSGALNITATSGSKFNINVWSLLSNGTNGALANFNPTLNSYSWTILTAGSISGFAADRFQINLDATNGTGGLVSRYKVNGFSIVQDGSSLKLMYSPPAVQTIDGTNNGTETASYTTNTSANSLTVNMGFFVDYLVVGGGGAGGTGKNQNPGGGGGGGGGGVLAGSTSVNASNYAIVVGAGGAAQPGSGNSGGSSSALGITALGGGGGAAEFSGSPGANGASGGGGGGNGGAPGIGTAGQGFGGGAASLGSGSGGGGASAAGVNASGTSGGAGGTGKASDITGTNSLYGAGGGGGTSGTGSAGAGGSGVGGNGGSGSSRNGTAGTANTGSGGGGAGGGTAGGAGSGNSGSGASGVVIIRYPGTSLGSVGGTVTAGTGPATGYTLHTFTTVGTLNFDLTGVNMNNRMRATLSGNVVGSGNLIYDGPGVLTLTGNNTYSGTTTISGGTLQVGSGSTTGGLGAGNIVNNATLSFNRSDAVTFSQLISGSGAVTHAGSGTTTLTGANTYTGTTSVSAGTLQLNRTGGTTIPVTNNVTVSGGTLQVSTDQELNNLTVSSGSLVVDAGVTLTISGTYTGGGTITNNGKIIVKGSSMFPGSTSTVSAMNSLEINRSAGVTLDKDISVTGTLTLTDGVLDIGSNTLTVSGSITGATAAKYIKTSSTGGLKRSVSTSAVSYPVGNSGYNPVMLTNKTGTADDFTVRVIDEVYANGTSSGSTVSMLRVKRTWDITKGTASANAGSGVDLSFSWDPASHTSGTLVAPKLYHYESSNWVQKSTLGNTTFDVSAGTLSLTGYTGDFSPFSIMDNASTLPVTWLSFTGRSVANGVELNWSTATEQHNAHFDVERSADAMVFHKIGRVNAAINPRIRNDYRYMDQTPLAGRSFYRLKQVDLDGKFSYSSIIQINGVVLQGFKAWVLPGTHQLNLQVPQTVRSASTLQVYDASGRLVASKQVLAGLNQIDLNKESGGVYYVRVQQGGRMLYTGKVVN
jgi:autotransporter-associated beta strand protein